MVFPRSRRRRSGEVSSLIPYVFLISIFGNLSLIYSNLIWRVEVKLSGRHLLVRLLVILLIEWIADWRVMLNMELRIPRFYADIWHLPEMAVVESLPNGLVIKKSGSYFWVIQMIKRQLTLELIRVLKWLLWVRCQYRG